VIPASPLARPGLAVSVIVSPAFLLPAVDFPTRESADVAIANLNGLQVYNKRLKLTLARPRDEVGINTNVYLSGIPLCWEGNEGLLRYLGSFLGEIIELRL
jgi:hypothetical protein